LKPQVDCQPIDLPDWAIAHENTDTVIADEEARMRFTIELARFNIEQASGGPFAAALFSMDEGRLFAIGLNSVVRLNSSVMHAEMMAILRAQQRLVSYTLRPANLALYASCEPCAMCLGGILWSGIRQLVCAAPADSARWVGFDEGPVDSASYRHLENAGIAVRRGLLADEADAVIQRYLNMGGLIYNG
jgi:tRNA(Arg) A34 adenosine deaminase TadA